MTVCFPVESSVAVTVDYDDIHSTAVATVEASSPYYFWIVIQEGHL